MPFGAAQFSAFSLMHSTNTSEFAQAALSESARLLAVQIPNLRRTYARECKAPVKFSVSNQVSRGRIPVLHGRQVVRSAFKTKML